MSAELLQGYDEFLEKSIEKYGELGIGSLIIRLQYLLVLTKSLAEQKDAAPLLEKQQQLLADVIRHYRFEQVPPSTLSEHISQVQNERGETVYAFDPVLFEERYGSLAGHVEHLLKEIDQDLAPHLQEGFWYLYAIDENDVPILFLKPTKLTDLVVNRTVAVINGANVVHPVLVIDRGLKVKAAGELSFVMREGRIAGVVANTKSGHFRPEARSAGVIRSVLAGRLGLLEQDITVIPVGIKEGESGDV